MDMSTRERFNVVYDGPALAEHRMDVRDLAPALIAISDLFASANKELNGDTAEVRVEVKASFKAGSFGIELLFTQDFITQIRDMFAGQTATALANAGGIIGLVGLLGGGLIGLLKKLRGRRPYEIVQRGEVAEVWITESESIEVDARVIKLWRSRTVRSSLEKTLSPLQNEGITDFGIVYNDAVTLELHDDDLPSFSATGPVEAEVVSDAITRKVLLLESVVFKEDNKWRVHDGQYPFHAALEDEEFLAKINAGERFGKGDVLVVDLRQVQTIDNGQLKTEYSIVKVHEHRAPLQRNLL